MYKEILVISSDCHLSQQLSIASGFHSNKLTQNFSYSGYAARLLTTQEINKACKITVGSEKVGELVSSWGEELVGEYGYSSVGAVVGATYPVQIKELREIMPKTYFLIPGYGAQGGKAEDLAVGFENGLGGIVNASRSLMCAFKSDRWKDKYSDEQYAEATRAEAIRMRDELNQAIK